MLAYDKPTDPCALSDHAPNSDGYACLNFTQFGRRINVKHHRVAYAQAHNISLADMKHLLVLHKCDVRNCINPNHLMLGTGKDNMQDAAQKGRLSHRKNNQRLTEQQVRDIRSRCRELQIDLAREYGVTQAAISGILLGKTWKNLL